MKKYQVILGFAVILLIGFALGYRVKDKVDKREGIIPTIPGTGTAAKPDDQQRPPTRDIFFLIRENNAGDILDETKRIELEQLFSTNRLKFHFRIVGRTPEDSFKNPKERKAPVPVNMGLVDSIRAAELLQQGVIVTPVFTASPKDGEVCFSEIQVVSGGSVQSLEGLAGKNIGIDQTSIALSSGIFKRLQQKGIIVKKMVIYKKAIKGLADLESGAIDVFFDRINSYSNGEVVSKLSTMSKGGFVGYPNLQILHTTNNKIPCKVVFLSSRLSSVSREEVKNKFVDVLMNPATKEKASAGLMISNLREMTPEVWKNVDEYYKQINTFQPKTFAEEIVYH